VSRDPADGENRRSPQVGDELVDGGDERSVGFGLPLADADVEGVSERVEEADDEGLLAVSEAVGELKADADDEAVRLTLEEPEGDEELVAVV
jgi:hypothetical protein